MTFGELSLLTGEPFPFTLLCGAKCSYWFLSRETILKSIEHDPALLQLFEKVSTCLTFLK